MTHEILIIGGGLVGAAAAVALKKQGRDVALIEIRPPQTDPDFLNQGWDARIYAISPANRALLQSLDAWPSESRIQGVSRMDVRGDSDGQIEFSAIETNTPFLTYIAENRWLLAALWQQIRALDIPVIQEAAVSLQTDIQTASLTLQNGGTLNARLIIGADGANSWVRKQSGIQVNETPYGQHGVVANFHTEKDHNGTAFQWFENGEILACLPLPDHKISMVWSTFTPEKLTSLPPEALAAEVTRKSKNVLGNLQPLSPAFAFNLILRRPESTSAQRIILMGDAAHTIHPLAGQGVNLGFGDVATFADISRDAADIGAYQLLRQYTLSRLAPVRAMQTGCDGLFRLFNEKKLPVLPFIRNTGLNLVNAAPWMKNRLIRHAMGL